MKRDFAVSEEDLELFHDLVVGFKVVKSEMAGLYNQASI
jgi:hypothetical protein